MLLSSNEETRLSAIERLRIDEQKDDFALDSLVKQAATLCNAPSALFTAVARESVFIKASFGCSFKRSYPRKNTFCGRVIETEQFLTGTFRRDFTPLRFFAGMPVFAADVCVGALCVLDFGEREFTLRDRNALAAIANAIGGILESRARLDATPDRDLVQTGLEFTDNSWMLFTLALGESLPRIEYANARAVEITGLSLEELTNNPERFYDRAGMADAVLLAIERARTNDPAPAHVAVQTPSGMRWLEGSARRLTDAPDGSMRFMTIARDITDQKRAEAVRDLLAETIRQTPEALFIVELKGDKTLPGIIYANDSFARLTGYERIEDCPGLLGDESDKPGILSAARANREGRSAEGETIMYRRDGSTFLAHYRAHVVDAPERHAVIMIKDVTDERRQQRQLAMLSAAVEEAEDFIAVADDTPVEEGGPFVVYVNPAIARASGYEPEELIGKPYHQLHSPNNPARMTDSVRESISNAAPGFRELLLRRKDGTDFWIEMVGRTFIDPATNRPFRLSVGRDITLRRRAFNQTALLLEATDQSSDAIVMYEPATSGDLIATYENGVSERSGKQRLLALWNGESELARRVRATLEDGGEVRERFAEKDKNGRPAIVVFSARSIRNEARLEAIVTVERVIAQANQGASESGQGLLLHIAGMLPMLTSAKNSDERFTILTAILLDGFGAEIRPSSAQLKSDSVHLATGWKGATFRLGDKAYAARWTRDLDDLAMTTLRLCIEAAIDGERKAASAQA